MAPVYPNEVPSEIIQLKIIPARDPKQCKKQKIKNKNKPGSWYHGPIVTQEGRAATDQQDDSSNCILFFSAAKVESRRTSHKDVAKPRTFECENCAHLFGSKSRTSSPKQSRSRGPPSGKPIHIAPKKSDSLVPMEKCDWCKNVTLWAGSYEKYHTSNHKKWRAHKEEVLGPSSWAGWQNTESHHITHHTFTSHHITHHTSFTSHHITHHSHLTTHISPHHTSHILHISPHHTFTSHHITHRTSFTSHHITHHTFTSHYITHHKPKVQKSTSFIVKTPLRTIPDQKLKSRKGEKVRVLLWKPR